MITKENEKIHCNDFDKTSWEYFGKNDPLWAVLTNNNNIGGKWDVKEFFQSGVIEIDAIMMYLSSLKIELDFNSNALDLGCGVGRLSQALAKYFTHIDAVDISSTMIENANKYNNKLNCSFHLICNNDLSLFDDNSFSFIYSNITLQHMDTHKSCKYITEFIRVLKPGGILLFQLPSHPNYTLKGILIRLLPVFVSDVLRGNSFPQLLKALLNNASLPKLKMRGTHCHEIIKIVTHSKAKIVDITPDVSAGSAWVSFRYCVSKPK